MALAEMYKQNNATYYESGRGMSGVFSDTIENLTANGMLDYSIFLNTGSTWSMKNTGTIGNHFSWYADWVGGVLAVRQGPDVTPITYLGSAILSKNTSCTVANLSAKQADMSGWNNFKNARFMIDAINITPSTAGQYNAFNYADYTGLKFGFNSCLIESIAGYATSNTAYNYTAINDYTTLTGDNAKRIVYSTYQVMLTSYNPYLADNDSIGKYNIGYIWDFFDIGGEIVCVRDILRMPNSAHWQSWAYYHDETDKYVTIGGFGGNVVAGTQGALPESDDVKGIYSYNHNGTSANWFVTKNAVNYKTNSMGLRWCVGNTTISTAKQWRDNVRLGVMNAAGVITHNQWLIGENAIQSSDNPNKNTDYDHIPAHGGGDVSITDKEHEMPLAYISGNAGMVTFYEINKTGLASADDISDAISRFDISQIGKDALRNLISFKAFAAISVNDTVDRQIKIAGIPLEDSGGNALTGRVIGGVKPLDLFATSGGVTIPTLYNDYRDYEPFTKLQMYVPFCGWFSLPSWCIGKKITGTMFTDLYNGTVKAVIYASQTVVAEVGGCCAYDIPFVADATGAKASAVISSALTTAAAVGATVAMPNVATGIAAVSSAANLAATLNGSDTTLKGVLGDGSNLNGLLHVYIKVSRPNSPNGSTAIPDSYKHEIGIPTMKEVQISAGDGYIQVMDAKVTGTMTAREKQMIVDGFRHGLNF